MFRVPNAIGAADWEGWVQERGLYFAHDWDSTYVPLLETHDPGEAPEDYWPKEIAFGKTPEGKLYKEWRIGSGGFHGTGAWELAVRYSYLDLDSGNVRGGTLGDTTVGVNWYTNAYCKLVANYIHSDLIDPTRGRSSTNIVAMRAQLDF